MSEPISSIATPGIQVPNHIAQDLRRNVAELLGRSQTNFPGAQPVSFTRAHIKEALLYEDYFLCEKSDGIRYLLYLTRDEDGGEAQYFIDRKNNYWFNPNRNLHFPLLEDRQAFHENTILDGELVMDEEANGQLVPRFLVFDCLVLGNIKLMDRTLDKRLAYFTEKIYKPYTTLLQEFPEERQYQPFELLTKDMKTSYAIEAILHEIPKLKHGNDGLIFTCRGSPYKHGTDPHILKWKPADENTVDCKLKLEFPIIEPDEDDIADGITESYIDYEVQPKSTLLTWLGGDFGSSKYKFFENVYITSEEWETLKSLRDPLDERIVECYLDDQKRWRISRFRDDKEHANHHSVLDSVLASIKDGVSQNELIAAQARIRDAWKARN